MGRCETYLSKIMGAKQQVLELQLEDSHNAGIIICGKTLIEHDETQVEEQKHEPKPPLNPTFTDYLRSGWQIAQVIAIDYTASNGEPTETDSLHFMGPSNQYEATINMVCKTLEHYDHDKLFPVFGFGGVPQGASKVSHCFNLLNGQMAQGVKGILAAYRSTLPYIKFSGPTYFAPILDAFTQHC